MYIGGVSCPVLGTVCMDMTVIDVSPFGERACGMSVEIMGEHVTASRLACILDTIEYEVLCNISGRVPRIYEGGC
jgi:alanine racemase